MKLFFNLFISYPYDSFHRSNQHGEYVGISNYPSHMRVTFCRISFPQSSGLQEGRTRRCEDDQAKPSHRPSTPPNESRRHEPKDHPGYSAPTHVRVGGTLMWRAATTTNATRRIVNVERQQQQTIHDNALNMVYYN